MKAISYWAKHHPWQTRVIIIMIYVLLNIIGISIGKQLTGLNVVLPEIYFSICVILTIGLWIGYPAKFNSNGHKTAYWHRKVFDGGLALVTLLMVIYAGNHWKYLFFNTQTAQATKVVPKSKVAITDHPLMKNFVSHLKSLDVSKLSQRDKMKLIKNQIKAIKHSKDTTKGEKTLLIVLSVIVAIALLIGLVGLSCSIACAGSETLALIVALGGTFLVIFFLIKVIKRINNPKAKPKPEPEK